MMFMQYKWLFGGTFLLYKQLNFKVIGLIKKIDIIKIEELI